MILLGLLGTSIAAYLIGAIPVGLLLVRLLKGIDVRELGSGKTGATNVLRAVGLGGAIATLLGDVAKGAVGTLLGRYLLAGFGPEASALGEVVGALASVAGHNWPVYTGGRGGRGVSTTLGATFVLSPLTAIIALPLALIIIAVSDMASLGSLLATLVGLAVLGLLIFVGQHPPAYAIFALAGGGMIVWQHRDNINRLLRGEERKLEIRKQGVRRGGRPT